ncbi:YiiD C-terminal domain-containing protein [Cognatilysobacter lacus]|uniref:Thioesterase n=1 Tax=Cognatilysobacter lacus TaxID=1643323 RepID=A0A5D8Z7W5_9GAMM|nr:YiiD C-terminal domain-containing protein [Lysobacter lacus]TZF90222.1 thioesterase [Lysobacter lacus]
MTHDTLAHLDAHYQGMPPVRALQLTVESFDGERLRLRAPLAANVNDKGCAFGGSLASLMTLACWGRVWLELDAAGLDCDIYVADSRIRYLAPLYGDLHAEAAPSIDGAWRDFLAAIRSRGRGRIEMTARIDLPDGRPAATFDARFAALLRPAAA